MSYKIERNTVQETLIIPLYARKMCSELYLSLYRDETARRLVSAVDYDFSTLEQKSRSLMQRFGFLEVAMRQNDIAYEVRDYLKTHPTAAVVNLGCGLDSTGRTCDNGSCRIYNLDFPDVIAVRNELLPAGEREENIPCDLNDPSWFENIDASGGAVFFAAGVFYYFLKEQVKELVEAMADAFPGGVLVFDAANAKAKQAEASAPAAPAAETAPAPPTRTPKEQIRKRYERLLKSLNEETREDQANAFLSALAQSYDPHSDYMSQRALDNFNIQMGLSLVGIGAELRSEDGYAKIQRLVPGGPAERGGQLKVNDRIVAVAQGNGEFEDVVDMKLDRVVERIRGKKGTVVRLQVLPASSADPSRLNVVTIVRDEVKLKDEEAKAQVIDVKQQGGARAARIGWITVPSFYANMNQRGVAAKSTTKDVAALLKRLKREGIEGLVIDLRRDSGGSLDEAVSLTGLFIPKGPVVQAKDTDGTIKALNDPDPGILWDGPLVVLINRLSASASEIFAAALQDYGRAVIVGDAQSFGKGTVQTLLDVDRFMPLFASSGKSGALKLTIQKFYRVKGGSTQLRGVSSDIVLPSLTDQPDVGEGALKNPLDYDEVPARTFSPAGNASAALPLLREASEARVAENPEFAYVNEDHQRLRTQFEKNAVSLNKSERLDEFEADKARRDARNAERKVRGKPQFAAVEVTLDTLDAPALQPVALDKPPTKSAAEELDEDGIPVTPDDEIYVDPVRDEALLIMRDYIKLEGRPPVTARAQGADTNTP